MEVNKGAGSSSYSPLATPRTHGSDAKPSVVTQQLLTRLPLSCSIVSSGLIYCMEYLEKNLTWLKQRIKEQQKLVPSQ